MAGPSFIHYNTTTDIVTGVFTTSRTPASGETEVNEQHPVFYPPVTSRQWLRTGVDTYVLQTASSFPEDNSVKSTSNGISVDRAIATWDGTDASRLRSNGPLIDGSDRILINTGSEAQPSIAFIADTDTGIRRVSTNELCIVTGGTDKLIVRANGVAEVNTASYETLVTTDNIIPNKKYVDDNNAVASGNVQQTSSEADQSSNSITPILALTFNTTVSVSGDYRIAIYGEATNSAASRRTKVTLVEASTTTLVDVDVQPSNGGDFSPIGGFAYRTLSANTTYEIFYQSSASNGTATVRRLRAEFWRVS